MLVGYQGEPGAFSEEAALALLPEAQARGFSTFDDLIEAVAGQVVERALLPVENSIYGSITRSYDLLWLHPGLTIIDETRARIVQALIGLPGASLRAVTEVRSHPVALAQCRRYLAKHQDWRIRSVEDTAGAVREIVQRSDPTAVAIGAARAATTYGAVVLEPAIQDDPENFTRFFLIARRPCVSSNNNRACVALTLPHRIGSLRDALDAFAHSGLNLCSLVARPSGEKPFHYRFYCELEAVDQRPINRALENFTGEVRLLGIY
jgi:prephenate dehydratase